MSGAGKKKIFWAFQIAAAAAIVFSFSFTAVYAWFFNEAGRDVPLEPDPFEVVVTCEITTDVPDGMPAGDFTNFMPGNSVFYRFGIIKYPDYAEALAIGISNPAGEAIEGMIYAIAGYGDGEITGTMSDMYTFTVTDFWGFAHEGALPENVPIGPNTKNGYADIMTFDVPPSPSGEDGMGLDVKITYSPPPGISIDDVNKLQYYSFRYDKMTVKAYQKRPR